MFYATYTEMSRAVGRDNFKCFSSRKRAKGRSGDCLAYSGNTALKAVPAAALPNRVTQTLQCKRIQLTLD